MNIYVGRISRTVSEDALKKVFEQYGQVDSVKLIKDRFTNELKGFGFVDMPNLEQAEAAIANLNNTELEGQRIVVNEARAPEARPSRPGGNGGGSRFGGSGNGGGPRKPSFRGNRY